MRSVPRPVGISAQDSLDRCQPRPERGLKATTGEQTSPRQVPRVGVGGLSSWDLAAAFFGPKWGVWLPRAASSEALQGLLSISGAREGRTPLS